jgi:hypothetical protein
MDLKSKSCKFVVSVANKVPRGKVQKARYTDASCHRTVAAAKKAALANAKKRAGARSHAEAGVFRVTKAKRITMKLWSCDYDKKAAPRGMCLKTVR